jgi:hypothetical protein
MPANAAEPKSRTIEEIILWIAIALFIALGVAYIAYPRFYYRHHPTPMFPIYPANWAAAPSPVYFFFAGITALVGFWHTRFSRWFGRDSSRILLWLFFLSGLTVMAGSWKYGIAVRFWTLATKEELYAAVPAMQIAGSLVKWGLWSSITLVILNFGYALAPKRQD